VHNPFYLPQNAIFFKILSFLLKLYVFHKPCAKL